MKPQSTGLKYFVAADKNGFIWDAFLYKGSTTAEIKVSMNDGAGLKKTRGEGTTKNIVEYMISRLRKKHIFFMDMYYGGLPVMDFLANKGHGAVLACQSTRPTDLFQKGLAAGFDSKTTKEWDWAYRLKGRPMLAVSFNDKKVCNFLTNVSTHHGIEV
jgi:hypothetical protein